MGQQIAEHPIAVGGSHNGLERNGDLCLLHQIQQGVHILLLEVCQNHCRRVGTRFQHQRACGLGLHLAQQLGHGLARIGRGDEQQLHAKSRSHAFQLAAVGGGKVPAQNQRDTGVLVACDMCFHKKTSFQGGLQIHYSITQIRKKWNAGGGGTTGRSF